MPHFLIQSARAAEKANVLEFGNITIDIWWWPYLFIGIEYFLIFLTVLFVLGIVLIIARIQGSFKIRIKEAVEEAMEMGKLPKTKSQREWEKIVENAESNNPQDYKKAVVMAENLFNRVLKIVNLSGENLEKRLKKIPDPQLEFKEDIIWAHNLKNKIVSDDKFEVDQEEAKRAVYIFERALKQIGVI